MNVWLLMGGDSGEREISLKSGANVYQALKNLGHEVTPLDVVFNADKASEWGISSDETHAVGLVELVKRMADASPDAVYLAFHGSPGEDGQIQSVLNLLRIPYTGSGVAASAAGMNKITTKRLMAPYGMPMTPDVVVNAAHIDWHQLHLEVAALGYPVIIKPVLSGSTVGVTRAFNQAELTSAVEESLQTGDTLIIEPIVTGIELSTPVIGGIDPERLPSVEIKPQGGFYDFERKYTPGATEEIIPAGIPTEIESECQRLSALAHSTLGCKGVTRSDFFWLPESNEIVFLEINTIPGMTTTSLVPRAAQHVGVSFDELVSRILGMADFER
ncbi:MAG: D-alanine--D-alanine ligase family protein [Armatimonadota bacterium]